MNRWASMAAVAVTVLLSAATVGGIVASQGVFDGSSAGEDQAADSFEVTGAPASLDGLALADATVVVVDREPIVTVRDVVVPDPVAPAARIDQDDDWREDDRDDDDDDHDRDHDDDRDGDDDDDRDHEDDDHDEEREDHDDD